MAKAHSPLRYPGGKAKPSKFIEHLLQINGLENIVYIEPFAGGFGAGLYLLFNNKVKSVIINDYNSGIYSFYYAILNETERLVNDIQTSKVNIEEWEERNVEYKKLLDYKGYSYDLGFLTFYFNRTNWSGILNGGPIGGRSQTGKYKIDCEFNKNSLIERILKISKQKDRIQLFNLDAIDLINKTVQTYSPRETFLFFDPPYYEQGKRLYYSSFQHQDHVRLEKKIRELDEHYYIITYDNNKEIVEIYKNYQKHLFGMLYYIAGTVRKKELLINSDTIKIESFQKVQIEKI